MKFAHGVDVTVLPRSAGHDVYGDALAPAGRGHTICGVGVMLRSDAEPSGQRQHDVVDTLTLVLPAGADVLRTDTLTLDDSRYPGTWRVDGDVNDVQSPISGRARGIVLDVRRAEA